VVDSAAFQIRIASPDEFASLRAIETESERLFETVGIGPFRADGVDHLSMAAVVLVSGRPPVGFASVLIVDGEAHLWQLSVHPSSGRQGRGRALLEAVCDWATTHDYRAVTLTTFRDIPWNAPFYASCGFVPLDDLQPGLRAIRDQERAIGDDDFGPRIAMRKDLTPVPGHG
jgi:GNAT superfamily N-acetyltransferase